VSLSNKNERSLLSDIVKETYFRAAKEGIILTPFNYSKIFIEVALEYGLSESKIRKYVCGTDFYVPSEEAEQMNKRALETAKNMENNTEKIQQGINNICRDTIVGLTHCKDTVADKAKFDMVKRILEKQRKELNKLKEFSFKDQLTGLYTRRYMNEALNTVFYNFNRYSRPCSIIMFDIDDFKKINDTYGHLAGDAVLRTVASVIQRVIRRSDIPVRYGGDEFIVILPDTMLENAVLAAKKIANKVQSIKFERNGTGFRCTISIGVTHIKESDTVETLLDRVDKALYEAKNKGKNGITVIKEPDSVRHSANPFEMAPVVS